MSQYGIRAIRRNAISGLPNAEAWAKKDGAVAKFTTLQDAQLQAKEWNSRTSSFTVWYVADKMGEE